MADPAGGGLPAGQTRSTGATTGEALPPGDPAIDPTGARRDKGSDGARARMGAMGGGDGYDLAWKVPPACDRGADTSTMRLATYKVPHTSGDSADAEVW